MAGSINPQRPEDVLGQDNVVEDISTNETEMKRIVVEALPVKHRIPGSEVHADEESGMWSMHEELVVWREPQRPTSFLGARSIFMVGAVLSVSYALIRSLEPILIGTQKGSSHKYYV